MPGPVRGRISSAFRRSLALGRGLLIPAFLGVTGGTPSVGAVEPALTLARSGYADSARVVAELATASWTPDAVEEVLRRPSRGPDDREAVRLRRLRLLGEREGLGAYRALLKAMAPGLSPQEARDILEPVVRDEDGHPVAGLCAPLLASARLADGDTTGAVELMARSGVTGVSDDQFVFSLAAQGRWGSLSDWIEDRIGTGREQEIRGWLDDPRVELPDSESTWLEARMAFATGDFVNAQEACRRLSSTKHAADAAVLLGRSLLQAGDVEGGREYLRGLDQAGTSGSDALLALARYEKRSGSHMAAVEAYRELANRWPRWRSKALWAAAWLEMEEGRQAEAVALIDELLDQGQGGRLRPEAMLQGIVLSMDMERQDEALRRSRALAQAHPQWPWGAAARFWESRSGGRAADAESLGPTVYREWTFPQGRVVPDGAKVWMEEPPGLAELLAPAMGRPATLESKRALDRAELFVERGLDDWARGEIRHAEKRGGGHGAQAPRLASLAWDAGALDVYLRLLEPWTIEPRWRYPLRYLDAVVEALDPAVGLDPLLVVALIDAESRGNPEARSPAGAMGLMQLLPGTANRHTSDPVTSEDLHFPLLNIEIGCRHLESLYRRFEGQEERVLAAYNAGVAAVDRWESTWPGRDAPRFVEGIEWSETRAYVRKILAGRAALHHLLGGTLSGPPGLVTGSSEGI